MEYLFSLLRAKQEFLSDCARPLGSKSSSIIPNLQMKKPKQGAEVNFFSLYVVTEVEEVLTLRYLWLLTT